MLIHDDVALNKLKTNYGIPTDVETVHPGPNEDANLVEGHADRILVRIWLIHQAGLRFLISSLLKEVMARYHLTFM